MLQFFSYHSDDKVLLKNHFLLSDIHLLAEQNPSVIYFF